MTLALMVQYNYNGTVTIAEPAGSAFFDYVDVATAKTLDEAKVKAQKYYEGTGYELVFIDMDGDEI